MSRDHLRPMGLAALILVTAALLPSCDRGGRVEQDTNAGAGHPPVKVAARPMTRPAPTTSEGLGVDFTQGTPMPSRQPLGHARGDSAADGGRSFMPLAVGNSWTYCWYAPPRSGPSDTAPICCRLVYQHGNRRMWVTSSSRSLRVHEETYKVVRHDAGKYFFTVSAVAIAYRRSDEFRIPPQYERLPDETLKRDAVRDGRYRDATDLCWTWAWGPDTSHTLTERIYRPWDKPQKDYFSKTSGWLIDDRFPVMLERGERWRDTHTTLDIGEGHISYTYNTRPRTVKVIAGTFENCIKTIERVAQSESTPGWETHMYWAPGVGKVAEYQQAADGTKTYEMQLTSFSVAAPK